MAEVEAETETRATWSEVTLEEVIADPKRAVEPMRPRPTTSRDVLLAALAHRLIDRDRCREDAERHRRWAEQGEDDADRLDDECRALADTVEVLETPAG